MPVIATKFVLEGEREYRQAIGEIGSKMQVLDSEMRKVSATYAQNANSTEALGAKNEVLAKKIAAQTEKIDYMREALRKATENYGEADKRTLKWRTSLNNAEAELAKLNNAVGENSAKIEENNALVEESEDVSGNLGDTLDALAQKFGFSLPDGMKKSLNGMGAVDAESIALAGGFAALVAAIVKVEQAMVSMTRESAAWADNIITLSAVTGQSTQQLQEFSYATDLIDVSVDTLRGSLAKMTNNMQDTMNGTGNAKNSFEALGVSVTGADGNMRAANEVFYETIDALGKVKNATERDAMAMDIFGRSAQELNPLIIQGASTLRQYAEEARKMGYVLDDEALSSLGAVDDALQRLKKTQEGVKNQIAVEFAPYLEKFYGNLTRIVADLGKNLKDSGIVQASGMLLETIGGIIAPMEQVAGTSVPKLTNALRPLAMLMAGIADTSQFLYSLLRADFKSASQSMGALYNYGKKNNVQTLRDSWTQADTNAATLAKGYGSYYDATEGKYYGNLESMANAKYEALWATGDKSIVGTSQDVWVQEYIKKLRGNSSGTDNWAGGFTRVGENGPEALYLPQGSRIMSASETRYGAGSGDIYIDRIVIDAKNVQEFEDVVRMVQNLRIRARMGVR